MSTGKSAIKMTGRHWLLLTAVGIVFFALVSEGVGNLFYWLLHGDIFYRRAVGPSSARTIDSFGTGAARPLIHPYFGLVYIMRPGVEATSKLTNNHLFIQDWGYVQRHPGCCDFPVRTREPDELIIGFTGGSVAAGTAQIGQLDDYLPRLLQQMPKFAGKRIRVLNFAAGGYKQPQQLLVLAYYLSLGQKFDAIVNVDGFNDAIDGSENGEHGSAVSFPSHAQWEPLTTFLDGQAGQPNSAGHLFAYHEISSREWTTSAERCQFAACYVFSRGFAAWHGLAAGWSKPAESGKAESYFAAYPGEKGNPLELAADQWASSVEVMHRLLTSHAIPFLSIVQPNQWFRATTPFVPHTDDQISRHFAAVVPPRYRVLLTRVPRLRASGVSVVDATAMFDDRGNEVYSDDYCHYSTEGYRILIKEIANWMERSPNFGASSATAGAGGSRL